LKKEEMMTRRYITKAKKEALLKASLAIIKEEGGQVTLRHLFYRLVGQGLLDKTEAGYKRLGNYTRDWRRAGTMPYSALADNTRWYYGAVRYESPKEAIVGALKNYKRDLWQDWDVHIEIWTEKDAMVSILLSEADPLGVQVFSTRGYASIGSMANTAAPSIKEHLEQGKQVRIFYFGDHDPSGKDIDRAVKTEIGRHLEDYEMDNFHFARVAVLAEDVEKYNLPTRPTKETDSRSENFNGDSVELDTMDIRVIKQRVRDCILEDIPEVYMMVALEKERLDQDLIARLVSGLQDGWRPALSSGDEDWG
jgi:hypothetical protein